MVNPTACHVYIPPACFFFNAVSALAADLMVIIRIATIQIRQMTARRIVVNIVGGSGIRDKGRERRIRTACT